MQHFLHNYFHYCNKYSDYLEKRNMKHLFFLNKQYFFFFFMWLINKKMYKETFLITNVYLAVLHVVYLLLKNHPNIFEIYLYSFMMVHILFSFIINNMYYRKLEIIFHKMPLSLYQEHHFKKHSFFTKDYWKNHILKIKYSFFPIKNSDGFYDISIIDLKVKSLSLLPTLFLTSFSFVIMYFYTIILFKFILSF